MSAWATWPSSWATTESSSAALRGVEQVVVEDDPLRGADPVDVRVQRASPGGSRRSGRPRRCRPRRGGRARARPRAPALPRGSGSKSLKTGARTTGASHVKTIATATVGGAPRNPPAAREAADQRDQQDAAAGGDQRRDPGRAGDVPRPRGEALGREPDVDGALVGGDARSAASRRASAAAIAAPAAAAPSSGRPASRSSRRRSARGRPSATATSTAPSIASPAKPSSRWPSR